MGNTVGKSEDFSDVEEIPFVMIELSEEKENYDHRMMYVFNQMELLLEDMERLVIGGESVL